MSDDNRKKDVGASFVVIPLAIHPCAPVQPHPDCPLHGTAAQVRASSGKVGYSREYADAYDSIFGKKQVVGQA